MVVLGLLACGQSRTMGRRNMERARLHSYIIFRKPMEVVRSHIGHTGVCITVGEECPHLAKHMDGYYKFATATMSWTTTWKKHVVFVCDVCFSLSLCSACGLRNVPAFMHVCLSILWTSRSPSHIIPQSSQSECTRPALSINRIK